MSQFNELFWVTSVFWLIRTAASDGHSNSAARWLDKTKVTIYTDRFLDPDLVWGSAGIFAKLLPFKSYTVLFHVYKPGWV